MYSAIPSCSPLTSRLIFKFSSSFCTFKALSPSPYRNVNRLCNRLKFLIQSYINDPGSLFYRFDKVAERYAVNPRLDLRSQGVVIEGVYMASKNKSLAYAVWSVLPGLDADAAEAALHRHKKTIKHFLAKNVRMRQVPEVRFVSAGQHFIGSKEKQRDLDERLDEIENELLRKGVL